MQCYSNHIHSTKLIGKLWLQTGDLADSSLQALLKQAGYKPCFAHDISQSWDDL